MSAASLKSENDCFRYVELSRGIKYAIEDYEEDRNVLGMLYLMYQYDKPDTVTFVLSADIGVRTFLERPTKYYSFYKGRVILIYTGEEKEYNPNAADIENFVLFLSNFDYFYQIIKCDWEKKELTMVYKGRFFQLYDPPTIQYYVDNNWVISKRMLTGNDYDSVNYYPYQRYEINLIFE